jgi:hypothetical protein
MLALPETVHRAVDLWMPEVGSRLLTCHFIPGGGAARQRRALRRGRARRQPQPSPLTRSLDLRLTEAVLRCRVPGAGCRVPGWRRFEPHGRTDPRLDAVDASGPGADGRAVLRCEQTDQGRRVYTVWPGSSTDAGDGSPRCPKDHPETSDSRPRQCIPPGGRGLAPAASTRASLRWM